MIAFSKAGMCVKGFFGFGAKTFGNPLGAISGNGGTSGAGSNPPAPPIPPPTEPQIFSFITTLAGGTAGYLTSDTDGATLFVTKEAQPRVFQSLDGGQTWGQIGTAAAGVTAQSPVRTLGGAFAFGASHTSIQVSDTGGVSWAVIPIALTGFFPIYLTPFGTDNWLATQAATPDPGGSFYALGIDAAGWEVFTQADPPNPPPPNPASVVDFSNNPCYWDNAELVTGGLNAALDSGILVSSAGNPWSQVAAGFQFEYVMGLGLGYVAQVSNGDFANTLIVTSPTIPGIAGGTPFTPPALAAATVTFDIQYFTPLLTYIVTDAGVVVSTDGAPDVNLATWAAVTTNLGGAVGQGQCTYDVLNNAVILTDDSGNISVFSP